VQRFADYFIVSSTTTAQEDDGNFVREIVARPELLLTAAFVKTLFAVYIKGAALSSLDATSDCFFVIHNQMYHGIIGI